MSKYSRKLFFKHLKHHILLTCKTDELIESIEKNLKDYIHYVISTIVRLNSIEENKLIINDYYSLDMHDALQTFAQYKNPADLEDLSKKIFYRNLTHWIIYADVGDNNTEFCENKLKKIKDDYYANKKNDH